MFPGTTVQWSRRRWQWDFGYSLVWLSTNQSVNKISLLLIRRVHFYPGSCRQSVLAGFTSAWHKLKLSEGTGGLTRENRSITVSWASLWGIFFILVIDVGRPSPLWEGPPLGWWSGYYKQTAWASHEEEASNEHPSMDSVSSLSSRVKPTFSPCL